jgi:hypothetical protein
MKPAKKSEHPTLGFLHGPPRALPKGDVETERDPDNLSLFSGADRTLRAVFRLAG